MFRSILRFLSNGDIKLIINNNDIHIYDGYNKYLNNRGIIKSLNDTLNWDNLDGIMIDRYVPSALSDTNVIVDGDRYIWYLNDGLFSKGYLEHIIKYVLDKLSPDDEEVSLEFKFTVILYWCIKETGYVVYNKMLDKDNDKNFDTQFSVIWE